MSAQIPETMLLSDLLKATGYDCPEELQGRTFAEATAGGDVQTNKSATVDVSAYTEPVVITPDTDYESMKKTTVTLENIPVAKTEVALEATENKTYTPEEGKVFNSVTVNVPPQGIMGMYCWKAGSVYRYTKVAEPKTGDPAYLTSSSGIGTTPAIISEVAADFSYIKLGSDVEFSRTDAGDVIF